MLQFAIFDQIIGSIVDQGVAPRGPWPSALLVVLQCRSGLLLKPDKNVSRVVGLGEGQDRKGCPYMRRVANPPSTSLSKLLVLLGFALQRGPAAILSN